jgi:hypothetical protein
VGGKHTERTPEQHTIARSAAFQSRAAQSIEWQRTTIKLKSISGVLHVPSLSYMRRMGCEAVCVFVRFQRLAWVYRRCVTIIYSVMLPRKRLAHAEVEVKPWPLRRCSVCGHRAPYLVTYSPWMKGRYCWKHIPTFNHWSVLNVALWRIVMIFVLGARTVSGLIGRFRKREE